VSCGIYIECGLYKSVCVSVSVYVCVCTCVCVRERACVCVCVCACFIYEGVMSYLKDACYL